MNLTKQHIQHLIKEEASKLILVQEASIEGAPEIPDEGMDTKDRLKQLRTARDQAYRKYKNTRRHWRKLKKSWTTKYAAKKMKPLVKKLRSIYHELDSKVEGLQGRMLKTAKRRLAAKKAKYHARQSAETGAQHEKEAAMKCPDGSEPIGQKEDGSPLCGPVDTSARIEPSPEPAQAPGTPEPERHLGMSARYLRKKGWKWSTEKGDYFKGEKDLTSAVARYKKRKRKPKVTAAPGSEMAKKEIAVQKSGLSPAEMKKIRAYMSGAPGAPSKAEVLPLLKKYTDAKKRLRENKQAAMYKDLLTEEEFARLAKLAQTGVAPLNEAY